MSDAAQRFEREWTEAFGEAPPVPWLLREVLRPRWFRIHTLPGSKRYAESDDERLEIALRQREAALSVLSEGERCWMLVPDWLPEQERLALTPSWARVAEEKSDPDLPTLVLGAEWPFALGLIAPLLRGIAEDRTRAWFFSPERRTLFAPYDGGVDLFFATTGERDEARRRLWTWASPHPHGL